MVLPVTYALKNDSRVRPVTYDRFTSPNATSDDVRTDVVQPQPVAWLRISKPGSELYAILLYRTGDNRFCSCLVGE